MPREGMLIQIDGSQHRWLGDDHPQLALHLAVDDATGKALAARFRPDEDTCGYFELLGDLIGSHGIPLALYSDRHSVFVPSLRSLKPKLAEGATQFARAIGELGIRQIFASSPQANAYAESFISRVRDELLDREIFYTLEEARGMLELFRIDYNSVRPHSALRYLSPLEAIEAAA